MKSLLIILVLLGSLEALKIKGKAEPKVRVRKSIHSLDPPERKALFWSIKALSILPPP